MADAKSKVIRRLDGYRGIGISITSSSHIIPVLSNEVIPRHDYDYDAYLDSYNTSLTTFPVGAARRQQLPQ